MAKSYMRKAPLMAAALGAVHGEAANALMGLTPLTPARHAPKPRARVAAAKAVPARVRALT